MPLLTDALRSFLQHQRNPFTKAGAGGNGQDKTPKSVEVVAKTRFIEDYSKGVIM